MFLPIPIPVRIEHDTSKLGTQGLIVSFLDLLLLIMKRIVLHKLLCDWPTTARCNSPKEFRKLNNHVQSQLMQLDLEFHRYIHQSRVRRMRIHRYIHQSRVQRVRRMQSLAMKRSLKTTTSSMRDSGTISTPRAMPPPLAK
jgi:hypothetical protein